MTINQFRQYRKNKGRRLLLQHEIDKLVLSGTEVNDSEIKWRKKEVIRLCLEMREVRDYLDHADPYIATMLRMHYIEGRRWKDIAQRVGGGNTQDSIRKMCHRYISKNKTRNKTSPEGCCLKEVVYCKFCKYNHGLAHGGEFNNDDIVCDYFNTDGLHEDDFCSHGIRKEGESEKAGQDKFER